MKRKIFNCKIRKGDEVIVQTGKDKGKTGRVQNIFPTKSLAIVSGINISFKHVKPSQGKEGGVLKKEMPIHVSNLSFLDPKLSKGCKIGFKYLENGDKVRYSKLSGDNIK
jgi:large subunit ribosomal protein L24